MKNEELYTICFYDENKTGDNTPKEVNDLKKTLSNFHGLLYNRDMMRKILDVVEQCVKEVNQKIAPDVLDTVRVNDRVLTIWYGKVKVMWIVPVELNEDVKLSMTKEGFTMEFAYGNDSFIKCTNFNEKE